MRIATTNTSLDGSSTAYKVLISGSDDQCVTYASLISGSDDQCVTYASLITRACVCLVVSGWYCRAVSMDWGGVDIHLARKGGGVSRCSSMILAFSKLIVN